jgi:hypothetical protein
MPSHRRNQVVSTDFVHLLLRSHYMFPWLLQKVVEGASELDGCYAKPLVDLR